MHARVSGVVDHLAEDDEHALEIVRSIVATLPAARGRPRGSAREPRPPAAGPRRACSTSSRSTRARPTTRARCSRRIVDGSELHEFKEHYGTTSCARSPTSTATPSAILANNGILFSESSLKAAHFIELCDRRGIPLLFLQNISGFMVGKDYEAGGIAKDGAKLVTAVSCARVPKLTVIVGGSFGAGNYGMCGRAYSPRFLFMWPNARISVMGGEQAATVMTEVGQPEAARSCASSTSTRAGRSTRPRGSGTTA